MPPEIVASELREYRNFSKVRKLLLHALARTLDAKELASLRCTFEDIDVNRSGTISVTDMQELLRGYVPDQEVDEIFHAANLCKSGLVEYSEFIAATLWSRIQVQ